MTRYAVVQNGEIIGWRSEAPNVNQSKLAEGKPRILPVEVNDPEFDPVTQVRSGPTFTILSDKVEEVYTVRDKNPDEIAEMKAAKVAAIKAEAQRRIYEIMPLHAQNNSLALFAEATLTHGPDASQWPEPLQDAVQERMAAWDTIKSIRAASDVMEADVAALTTAAEVAAYDITAGWPE